MNSQWN